MSKTLLNDSNNLDKQQLFATPTSKNHINYPLTVTGDSFINSQINLSPSKASYKFCKTARFPRMYS